MVEKLLYSYVHKFTLQAISPSCMDDLVEWSQANKNRAIRDSRVAFLCVPVPSMKEWKAQMAMEIYFQNMNKKGTTILDVDLKKRS